MSNPTGAGAVPSWSNDEPEDVPRSPKGGQDASSPTDRRIRRPSLPSTFPLNRLVAPTMYGVAMLVTYRLLAPIDTVPEMLLLSLLAIAGIWTIIQYSLDRTADRPPPKMGLPTLTHRLARLGGMTYVPEQGVAELLSIAGRQCFDLLQTRSVVVGVYGPKGGVGKTTVATVIAFFVSLFSKKPTLIVDAREKRGNITEAMGFWRRLRAAVTKPSTKTTLTLRQALDLNDEGWFDNATDMHDLMPSVENMMLHVIASDHIESEDEWRIEIDRVVRLFETARRHYKFIVFETTDDVHSPLNRALLRVCDIPVFVHRVNMPNSLAETKQGFSIYRGEFGQKIREHGVLFVLAATRGQNAQYWADKFKNAVPPERIMPIPRSKFYETDQTDPGFEDEDLRDEDGLPSRTRSLEDTPAAIAVRYVDGINAGIETIPPGVVAPSHHRSSEVASPDAPQFIGQVSSTDASVSTPQYT